jgi:hypothetical protein
MMRSLKAKRMRRRKNVCPPTPQWATESTQEVEALTWANHLIEWAHASTGMLRGLRAGLESLDLSTSEASGAHGRWTCRSGEPVDIGDTVALRYGLSPELVGRIIAGDEVELRCQVVRGVDASAGEQLMVSPDQLLLKVFATPAPRTLER